MAGAAVGDDPVYAGVAGQAPQGGGVEDGAVESRPGPCRWRSARVVMTLRWGRWRPPRRCCWWSRNRRHTSTRASARRWAGLRAGSPSTSPVGGQAEGGGDDGAALGVEAAGQFAAAVEDAGQVQRPLRQHRFGVVAHHGVGPSGPVLHRDRGVVTDSRANSGTSCGLVAGEQADGAVLEVGDDGLDLPARQDTVVVGAGGDRQLPEPAGGLGAAGGVAAGLAGVVA